MLLFVAAVVVVAAAVVFVVVVVSRLLFGKFGTAMIHIKVVIFVSEKLGRLSACCAKMRNCVKMHRNLSTFIIKPV